MEASNQNQALSKQARSKVTYLFDLCSIFQRTGSLIFLLCFSALKIALSMSSSQTMRILVSVSLTYGVSVIVSYLNVLQCSLVLHVRKQKE